MINVKKQTKTGVSKDDPEHHCLACGRFNTSHTSHVGTASSDIQSPGSYIPWKKTFGKENPKKANVRFIIYLQLQLVPAFSRMLQKKREEILGANLNSNEERTQTPPYIRNQTSVSKMMQSDYSRKNEDRGTFLEVNNSRG